MLQMVLFREKGWKTLQYGFQNDIVVTFAWLITFAGTSHLGQPDTSCSDLDGRRWGHTKHRKRPRGTSQKTTKERSVNQVHTNNKQTH